MQPQDLLTWAVYIGFAFFILSVFTGFDDIIARFVQGSPTKKDLHNRISELEQRIAKLESSRENQSFS